MLLKALKNDDTLFRADKTYLEHQMMHLHWAKGYITFIISYECKASDFIEAIGYDASGFDSRYTGQLL